MNKNVDTDIMVGAQSIKYNPQTPSQGAQIDINDTMESISVSILCKQQVNSPPSESEFISQYAANIKIELTPLETTIDLWKIGIYNSIQKAYQNQLKKYYEQMKRQEQQILVNNPNLYEQLKKGQLITKSIELLFAKAQQLVNLDIDSFKYNQYFKNSLDWDSMLCHFTQDKDKINYNENIFLKELDSLIHFRNFIRAKSVLILLPVHSIHTFSFIYFLNTGNIWQGKDTDCPVIHQSIQLCNELKKIENKENEGRKEEWTITIPTSMSVLSKSDNLPNL